MKYVIRRLTFTSEIRGILPKIQFFGEELVSLSTRIRPSGPRLITWKGPRGDLKINFYDSIVCWRDEILDQKLYDVKLKSEYPIILDIGANQGFFTLWMKYNYPDAVIYAYEPFKKSFDIIVKNISDNCFHNISAKNFGILDKDCFIPFYHIEGGAGLGDSIVPAGPNDKKEECRFCNIDADFDHVDKIDLIKMDIEGSEYTVLKNCNFWKKANQFIIEFHDGSKDKLGFGDIDFIKLIKNAGFKLNKRLGKGAVYQCYFSKQCNL
jgi:FkbM family methyltransferase